MRKLKVLFVSNTLSCGGGERQITLLANALNAGGLCEVDVLYYGQKGGTFSSVLEREPIYVDKDRLGPVGCIREIRRILREGRYDVMHAAGGGTANIYGRLAALFARTPLVIGMLRGKDQVRLPGNRLANNVINLFRREWSVNNPALTPILCRDLIGIRAERVHLLYNGFAPASSVDYRRGEVTDFDGMPEGAFVFGSVGRCIALKNFPLFLRAADRVLKQHENAYFWIIGDGPELAGLKELSASLSLGEHVRFFGQRTDVDVALSRMDVYVHPSDSEGTPNAILEALRAALPVISTESTDLSLIVQNGQNGCLIPCGDEDAMVASMERMITAAPEVLRAFGERSAHLFEENFLMENTAKKWVELYERLLTKKGLA